MRSNVDVIPNVSVLLLPLLFGRDYSLREAASTAYSQVCAPYHTWGVRTAVCAGMYTLPTRDQLLLKLNETGEFESTLVTLIVQPRANIPQDYCQH